MKDIVVLRRNERLKAFTGQFYNLSTALFGGAIVKVYGDQDVGLEVALWIVGSIGLTSVGHGLLGLLEDEE